VVTGVQTGSRGGAVPVGDQPGAEAGDPHGRAARTELAAVRGRRRGRAGLCRRQPGGGGSYQLVDFQRDVPLVLLVALLALGLSFAALALFVLPSPGSGWAPSSARR
jgi:hypothetical protein